MTATGLFRHDLLADRAIVLAGAARPAVGSVLSALGARVVPFDEQLDEEAAEAWARAESPLSALVYDAGRRSFGDDELLTLTEHAWTAVRALATGALIPGGDGGKVVLLAPPPGAWRHAGAARAAFENLARTLSVEWARYGITATAISPADATTDDELATLVGYLVSPAGDYFSGCEFELRGALVE
jgi:NAD(P)-dependent dehydrogenase (short-subunit alcohol dehydrogenase family)